jgi:uncharacterized membrane protein
MTFRSWIARPRNAAWCAAIVLIVGALPRLIAASGYASDLGRYYAFRDLHPGVLPYLDRAIEYPVVSGAVLGVASLFTRDARALFLINAFLLATLAALLAFFLAKRYGSRVAWFAAAPTLAIAGPVNWDLVAVVPATLALLAVDAGQMVASGVLLGVGIAAKVFPVLFLPPLMVARVRARAVRSAIVLGVSAVLTVVVINVPVALAAPHNWRYFFTFQSSRVPTWGTLSFYVLRPPIASLGWLSDHAQSSIGSGITILVTGFVLALVCVRVWQRRMSAQAAILVALIAFLLSNKVYSPQYDLWVLPFFALLPIPRRTMYAFYAVDAAMFLAVFGAAPLLRDAGASPVVAIAPVVVARAIVLVAVCVSVWRVTEPAGVPTGAN